MKPLWVGRDALIAEGKLLGYEGEVVGFDSENDEAMVKLEDKVFVILPSEYLVQKGESIQLSMDLE